jgi:hypothetical protein
MCTGASACGQPCRRPRSRHYAPSLWRTPTSPDTRRIDKHDEDLRALSDTVLDIREIGAGHSEVLAGHTEVLDRHTQMLDEQGATLAEHGEMLIEILRRLEPAG